MNVKLLHFYPDLMNLYGSYANVALVRRTLERMGNSVALEPVLPGAPADLSGADLLFMGAGTERAQKAALTDLLRFAPDLKAAFDRGAVLLFVGSSMELLGRSITDRGGTTYEALGLLPFTSVQGPERYVEDVYAHTDLYDDAVVGFMNKCSDLSGVASPLLTSMAMGYGNDGPRTPEGCHEKNLFASQLTGPLLVKNPRLLKVIISAIYTLRNEKMPEIPLDDYLTAGYAVTAEQLRLRSEKE